MNTELRFTGLISVLVLWLVSPPAAAVDADTSANITIIAPPDSLVEGVLESETMVFGVVESVDVTLGN